MTRASGRQTPAEVELKRRLRKRLLKTVDLATISVPTAPDEGGRREGRRHPENAQDVLRQAIVGQLGQEREFELTAPARERLIQELTNELIGYGPIATLMEDTTISEIMINGPSSVFIERSGRIEHSAVTYRDEEHLLFCIERMLDPLGLSINESEPFADASLPDGSRLNVIIAPLSLNGPIVTIRKQLASFKTEDLVSFGSLTPEVADFLKDCVKAHVNIVVSGGTSTGKTTLVTALSAHIAPDERVITIENVAEIQLVHTDHWLRLVARPPNVEGRGEITVRQLVKNALRMRPDRIILGEARGSEALDTIQAMHTGHEGFFTVLHANSPQAALERLETLMLMSEVELPPHACRMQIASAIELLIHMSRYPDGTRRISKVSQVTGVTDQGFLVEDLFTFEIRQLTPDGRILGGLQPTGKLPKFTEKFATHNITSGFGANKGAAS